MLLRKMESNHRPLGYEPNELPLLHSAMLLQLFSQTVVVKVVKMCSYINSQVQKNQFIRFLFAMMH